jgi:hypothetical protein
MDSSSLLRLTLPSQSNGRLWTHAKRHPQASLSAVKVEINPSINQRHSNASDMQRKARAHADAPASLQ